MSHKYLALLRLPECVIEKRWDLKQNLCIFYFTFPVLSSHNVTHMQNDFLILPKWRLLAGLSTANSNLNFVGVKSQSPGISGSIQTSELRYPWVNRVCILRSGVFLLCDLRASFYLPLMHKFSLLSFFPINSPGGMQGVTRCRAGARQAYLHFHPPHAHDIVLDDDRDGICPPCKRNTHTGGQQPVHYHSSLYTLGLGG